MSDRATDRKEMHGSREMHMSVWISISVVGGEWEGLSIIPNHLYSAVHITSP